MGAPQAFMARETDRSLRRAARRQIRRRGAEGAPCGGDPACDNGRVVELIDPQRDVEPRRPALEACVGERKMNL